MSAANYGIAYEPCALRRRSAKGRHAALLKRRFRTLAHTGVLALEARDVRRVLSLLVGSSTQEAVVLEELRDRS